MDQRSARQTDLYLTTHNTHKRQTSTPPASDRRPTPQTVGPQGSELWDNAIIKLIQITFKETFPTAQKASVYCTSISKTIHLLSTENDATYCANHKIGINILRADNADFHNIQTNNLQNNRHSLRGLNDQACLSSTLIQHYKTLESKTANLNNTSLLVLGNPGRLGILIHVVTLQTSRQPQARHSHVRSYLVISSPPFPHQVIVFI